MSQSPLPEAPPFGPWADHELPPMLNDFELPSWAGVVDSYLHGARNDENFRSWGIDVDYGDSMLLRFPSERVNALQHRLFLHRAVRYMSSKGVEQLIDLGSGLIGPYSTHEVVDTFHREQGRGPDVHVCYVENVPHVSARATVVLDRLKGRRRPMMIEGDLRRPDELRSWIEEEERIDFSKPVGLVVTGTMQLEQRNRQGKEVGPDALRHFAGQLATGSYMAISHVTNEVRVPGDKAAAALLEDIKTAYNNTAIGAVLWRSKAEIESLFGAAYRPVEGGWAAAELWGQGQTGAGAPRIFDVPDSYPLVWAGVGRKE